MDVLEEEDVGIMHPMVSRMDTFHSTVELDSACEADHEDGSLLLVVIGLSFSVWHVWVVEIHFAFPFVMYFLL